MCLEMHDFSCLWLQNVGIIFGDTVQRSYFSEFEDVGREFHPFLWGNSVQIFRKRFPIFHSKSSN